MTLAAQYDAIFELIYNDSLRADYRQQPINTLMERGLSSSEAATLANSNAARLDTGALLAKIKYLAAFYRVFPHTLYLLTAYCQSLDLIMQFFQTQEFHACFQENKAFLDAFDHYLGTQLLPSLTEAPYLMEIYAWEVAIQQIVSASNKPQPAFNQPTANKELSNKEQLPPASSTTMATLSTTTLVQRDRALPLLKINYPIPDMIIYISTFKNTGLYKVSPLFALVPQAIPSLQIHQPPLANPLGILFLPNINNPADPKILKFEINQYEALLACNGQQTVSAIVARFPTSLQPKIEFWLNYCWDNQIIYQA